MFIKQGISLFSHYPRFQHTHKHTARFHFAANRSPEGIAGLVMSIGSEAGLYDEVGKSSFIDIYPYVFHEYITPSRNSYSPLLLCSLAIFQ